MKPSYQTLISALALSLLLPLMGQGAIASPSSDSIRVTLGAGASALRLNPRGEIRIEGASTLLPHLRSDFDLSYRDGGEAEDVLRVAWGAGDIGRYIGNYQLRRMDSRALRSAATGRLTWQPSELHKLSLRAGLRLANTWDRRYNYGINNIVPREIDGETVYIGEVERLVRVGSPLSGRFPSYDNGRLKQKITGGVTLAGTHRFHSSPARVSWSADYQRLSDDCPNERALAHYLPAVTARLVEGRYPRLSYGKDDIRSYGFRKISEKGTHFIEETYGGSAGIDIPTEALGDFRIGLKAGRQISEERDFAEKVTPSITSHFPTFGAMPKMDLSDAAYLGGHGGTYQFGTQVDYHYVGDIDTHDEEKYVRKEDIPSYLPASYRARMDRLSGEIGWRRGFRGQRLTLSLGSRFSGYRLEGLTHTVIENRAGDEVTTSRRHFTALPYLTMNYDAGDGWQVSTGIETEDRMPAYKAMIPYNKHSSTDLSLTVGNPELRPEYRVTATLEVEKMMVDTRLSALLSWSGSRDQLYSYSDPDLTFSDFRKIIPHQKNAVPVDGHWTMEMTRNIPFAQLVRLGVKLDHSLRRSDWSLLRPLSIHVDYTLSGSRTSSTTGLYGTTRAEVPLSGLATHKLHTGLSYQQGHWGLSLSGDIASARCLSAGETAEDDLYQAPTTLVSLEGYLKLSEKARVTLRSNNLFNTPIEIYQGAREYLYSLSFTGPTLTVGLQYVL